MRIVTRVSDRAIVGRAKKGSPWDSAATRLCDSYRELRAEGGNPLPDGRGLSFERLDRLEKRLRRETEM